VSTAWPRFQSMPEDGRLWLLTWLGPFYIEPNMTSQRSVLAVVSALRGSKGRSPSKVTYGRYPSPNRVEEHRLVSFAVGDLPALAIGTLYREGRPLTRSKSPLKVQEFRLDFDRQQVVRLGAPQGAAGRPVVPELSEERLLLGGVWDLMGPSACVALPLRDDPLGLVVPVTEVLRWCYGSSSRMLQAVLSGDLVRVLDEIIAGSSQQGGKIHLNLPPGFVEADAHTLAWLASDTYARERALTVDRSVLVSSSQIEHRPDLSFPGAVFPYTGPQQLNALGRWLPRGAGLLPRFLVHRVVSTSFQPAFTPRLTTVEHHAVQGRNTGQAVRNRPAPPAAGRRSTLTSKVEPRRVGNPARLLALPSQFSNLPVAETSVTAPPALSTLPVSTETPTGLFSTGLGIDAASRARRATLVHRPENEHRTPPVRSDGFETLRRVLSLLEAQGFTIAQLAVNHPGGAESRFRDWQWPGGQGESIACLIAELSRGGGYAYLFEKERRGAEYSPLLIARHENWREAAASELQALLDLRAGGQTWPRTHGDWVLVKVPHTFTTDQSFGAGIIRHLGPFPTSQS
jgi:hypothetical protein